MQNNPLLHNISIVLVDTRYPANIGSTARCMMNMGLDRLVLVNPPKDGNDEATRLAAGAEAILKQALVTETLAEAIKGRHLVIGASRHPGRLRRNVHTPREMAGLAVPLLEKNNAAIVFGNEINGLDNSDLALCHEIVAIPASAAFPSLNLSHAVMVVAYELFLAAQANVPVLSRQLAPAEDLENFYGHLEQTLQAIGFFGGEQPDRMMFTFRQLFGRARLEDREINVLRGVLSSVNRVVRPKA